MLSKKENAMNNLFSFITIFDWSVWCMIIATIFITAFLMFIFDRLNFYNQPNKEVYSFQDFIWKTFGVFALGHLSGVKEKSQRSLPSKITMFGFYVYCFICIIFYQANLAVFLTVARLSSSISSINDLQESSIEYNLVGSTSTQVFFEDMKSIEEDFYEYWVKTSLNADNTSADNKLFWEYPLSNLYSILSNNMRKQGYLNTTEEGEKRVLDSSSKKKFVFFTEYPSALYAIKKYCDMEIVGKQFSSRPYAIGVNRKNALLKDALNFEILILQREGKISELKTKWWNYESKNCKETTDTQINIQTIGGLFIIMGVFCLMIIVLIIFEFLWSIKKDNVVKL
jgi:hypothetical protein